MEQDLITPFDMAAKSARSDMVKDILRGMKGRTFGVDYTTVDGRERRMLVQVVQMHDEHATVREINLTQAQRKDAVKTFRSLGFTYPDLSDEEKRLYTEYRTLRYDGVNEIRVAHKTYDIRSIFEPVG